MPTTFRISSALRQARAGSEYELSPGDVRFPRVRLEPVARIEWKNLKLSKKYFTDTDCGAVGRAFTTYGKEEKISCGKVRKSRPYRIKILRVCTFSFLLLITIAMSSDLEQLLKPTDPTPLDWDARLTDANKRTHQGVKLSLREVRSIVEIWSLPPFLSVEEAAKIYRRSVPVLRNHISEGRFPRSAIVGKPLMFVTTRFLQEVAARLGGSR